MDGERRPQLDDSLAADGRWLQALAERLIRDPALADDACQEAWLTACHRGATDDAHRRSMLFRWMRRFAWRWRRAEERRARRESVAPAPAFLPPTAELLSRGEQRRLLWQRLSELDEPYRTALLLRFQEGMDTKSIATRTGSTDDTVRRRLRRGLEQLRARYERDGDDAPGMASLAVAALPLAASPQLASAGGGAAAAGSKASLGLYVGAWTMKKSVLAVSAFALAAVFGAVVCLVDDGVVPAYPGTRVAAVSSRVDERIETEPAGLGASGLERTAVTTPPAGSPVEEPPGCRVVGVVVDGSGMPLANAAVRLVASGDHGAAEPRWAQSSVASQDGAFAVTSDGMQGQEPIRLVVTASPMHQRVVLQFGAGIGADFGALVVPEVDVGRIEVQGAGVVHGRLLDHVGAPVVDAWLDLDVDGATCSDPDGRFRIEHVLPGQRSLEVAAAGHLVQDIAVEVSEGQLIDLGDIVLAAAPRVTGVVTDLDGRPLPGAMVSTRGFTRGWLFQADAAGRFDVPLPKDGPASVIAAAAGHVQSEGLQVEPGQSGVLVALAKQAARGRFVIVDADRGAVVTRFGFYIREDQGAEVPAGRRAAILWREASPMDVPSGQVSAPCRAGLDRYDVFAPGYLRAVGDVTDDAFSAGGQRIELRAAPSLRGRVVDQDGRPVTSRIEVRLVLADVARVKDVENDGALVPLGDQPAIGRIMRKQLGIGLLTMVALDRPLPGFVQGSLGRSSRKVFTDAEGRFCFRQLTSGVGRLFATGPSGCALPATLWLVEEDHDLDLGDLQLVELANVRGRVVPATASDLSDSGIVLESEPGRSAEVSQDGSFELVGIVPGDHWFTVKPGPGICSPRLWARHYYFHVAAGGDRALDVPIPAVAACQLQVTLRVNGEPPRNGAVGFVRAGTTDEVGGAGLDQHGSATVSVPAGVPLDVSYRLDETELAGPTNVVLPHGTLERTFELATSAIEVAIPRASAVGTSGSVRLRWRSDDGASEGSLHLSLDDGERVLGARDSGDLRLVFPCVPATARNFEVDWKEDEVWSETPWRVAGAFVAHLVAGETRSCELQ